MRETHKEFIEWAKKQVGDTDMKGRELQIRFFHDGEPYIGTYPDLRYSVYRKELLT